MCVMAGYKGIGVSKTLHLVTMPYTGMSVVYKARFDDVSKCIKC